MKKSCLVGLAGVLGIMGVANANMLDALAGAAKTKCLQNPDWVWDETTSQCVPFNVCWSSDSFPDWESYCDETFADISLDSKSAREVVNTYRERNNLGACVGFYQDGLIMGSSSIRCKTAKGGYVEYRFAVMASETPENSPQTAMELDEALCKVYGGAFTRVKERETVGTRSLKTGMCTTTKYRTIKYTDVLVCRGVSEKDCHQMWGHSCPTYDDVDGRCIVNYATGFESEKVKSTTKVLGITID